MSSTISFPPTSSSLYKDTPVSSPFTHLCGYTFTYMTYTCIQCIHAMHTSICTHVLTHAHHTAQQAHSHTPHTCTLWCTHNDLSIQFPQHAVDFNICVHLKGLFSHQNRKYLCFFTQETSPYLVEPISDVTLVKHFLALLDRTNSSFISLETVSRLRDYVTLTHPWILGVWHGVGAPEMIAEWCKGRYELNLQILQFVIPLKRFGGLISGTKCCLGSLWKEGIQVVYRMHTQRPQQGAGERS